MDCWDILFSGTPRGLIWIQSDGDDNWPLVLSAGRDIVCHIALICYCEGEGGREGGRGDIRLYYTRTRGRQASSAVIIIILLSYTTLCNKTYTYISQSLSVTSQAKTVNILQTCKSMFTATKDHIDCNINILTGLLISPLYKVKSLSIYC